MCRYIGQYSCRWACFDCRKAFKASSAWEMGIKHGETRLCPECGCVMWDLGQDFSPPRQEAKKKWKVIKAMAESGWTAHSCGC